MSLQWFSNSRPAMLHYAVCGHICKLCICYEDYTIIYAVRCTFLRMTSRCDTNTERLGEV
jgi:hypothetical protein